MFPSKNIFQGEWNNKFNNEILLKIQLEWGLRIVLSNTKGDSDLDNSEFGTVLLKPWLE